MKLRSLTLRNKRLPDTPQSGIEHLHIARLEVLHPKRCTSVDSFSPSLAERYNQTGRSALKNFSNIEYTIWPHVQETFTELIGVVNGLTKIAVGTILGGMIDLESFATSGGSIYDLPLFCSDDNVVHYSAEDLEQLRIVCPNFEDLSVDLGDLSSVFDNVCLIKLFHLAGQTGYVEKFVSSLRLP